MKKEILLSSGKLVSMITENAMRQLLEFNGTTEDRTRVQTNIFKCLRNAAAADGYIVDYITNPNDRRKTDLNTLRYVGNPPQRLPLELYDMHHFKMKSMEDPENLFTSQEKGHFMKVLAVRKKAPNDNFTPIDRYCTLNRFQKNSADVLVDVLTVGSIDLVCFFLPPYSNRDTYSVTSVPKDTLACFFHTGTLLDAISSNESGITQKRFNRATKIAQKIVFTDDWIKEHAELIIPFTNRQPDNKIVAKRNTLIKKEQERNDPYGTYDINYDNAIYKERGINNLEDLKRQARSFKPGKKDDEDL